ncbi:DNA translocase FtsK [Schleiferiaceae bacterium]|nr:DNA translocase FtsK [Schleiferiaceae bacterium]
MAKKSKTPSRNPFKALASQRKAWKTVLSNPSLIAATGFFLLTLLLFVAFATLSGLATWSSDFSAFEGDWSDILTDKTVVLHNALGNLGALLAYLLTVRSFGVAVLLLLAWGIAKVFSMALNMNFKGKTWLRRSILWTLMLTWLMGILPIDLSDAWVGDMGRSMAFWTNHWLGSVGAWLAFAGLLLMHVTWLFKLDPLQFKTKSAGNSLDDQADAMSDSLIDDIAVDMEDAGSLSAMPEAPLDAAEPVELSTPDMMVDQPIDEPYHTEAISSETFESTEVDDNMTLEVETMPLVDEVAPEDVKKRGDINTAYDPTLDLSNYQLPRLDLLKPYDEGQVRMDKDELEANKVRIIETLENYNIKIASIKAAVGPTVTLYEIVPEKGVRISKIKSLEDDIALSLSALGIRIIAPIPGRGTIGIEVPNRHPQMVSMQSVLSSDRFQKSNMDLPIALGKTIANEVFVADLAKMPHLLMAGATGQGKSVGLNAILASILYKKHPSEVKFVLVDPKKVELTLYNKIERHFLAKLPDSEEAIITDTTKVINTLNSLCIEMDQRYDLLKAAMVRNIKEYNVKFKARKLSPDDNHRYLPYIILVIDEFADLIMTAGKEVEMPIARLAQLARAIGIHLIVATQRPSVNVITGIIKANFPARIAFKVSSKIDSRTILDASGADQLIGKGDMLFHAGNEMIRLQCAFLDTPEVEDVCEFIGSQQAYPDAYALPEYTPDGSASEGGNYSADERDALFRDAALIVVNAQQGSASLLQRKLKLGYNRAGRIVDQLEDAGILGPFEGSKARQVLVPDEMRLKELIDG